MKPFITLLLLVAAGVSTAPAKEAKSPAEPRFDPVTFFAGHTLSSGVFENRRGQPTRVVKTETRGRMVGGELQIEQDLYIGEEPRQRRTWKVRRIDATHFSATATGIIGTARGEAVGNRFSWTFTLAPKPGNPLFNVRMTQHMYLQPDGRTMINRSLIRKFGFLLAAVTEQFRRD